MTLTRSTPKTKYSIQVRKYLPNQTKYGSETIGKITGDYGKFEIVETVKLTVKGEPIGNFNPIFTTYKGMKCLVHSDEGDLSDPFRRTEEYANTFFIVQK